METFTPHWRGNYRQKVAQPTRHQDDPAHKSVETTQIYTQVRLEEIIDQVLAHYARPTPTPIATSAVGYDEDDLGELFG